MTFIKLFGSNSNISSTLIEYFPDFRRINGYIDPFLGGGNVFQKIMQNYYDELRGKPVYLSDINKGLINSYRIVRDHVGELVHYLELHQKLHSEKHYNDIKKEYNSLRHLRNNTNDLTYDIEDAARFIYLNNCAFRGLWRENKDGNMNSCFGNKSEFNFNYNELYYFSRLLTDVYINAMSFEKIVDMREDIKGYFVYLSPPYDNINDHFKPPNFKQFDRYGFAQRYSLLLVFRKLDEMGCKVMLSNSYKYSIIREFDGYNIFDIQTNRRKGVSRRIENTELLKELIVTNYEVRQIQQTIDDAWG